MSVPVDNLKQALCAARDRFEALNSDEFLRCIWDMCTEADLDRSLGLEQAMIELAGRGSIDAVGALVVMGASDENLLAGLRALAERSDDVREGFALDFLTAMVEEMFEAEVAAGRMIVTVDPATGQKLYGSKPDGAPS
jgi:hypothetical protein